MGHRLRLASVATGSFSPLLPCNTPTLSTMLPLLLFFMILHSGQAYVVRWNNSAISHPKTLPHLLGSVEGYSLAAAKDGSRISTTAAPFIVTEEHHRGQAEGGRGGHGIQHHGHGHVVEMQQPLKHHHQQPQGEESPKTLPDFEKQLSQLKEDPGSVVESKPQQIIEDNTPIKPVSRKDDLFTPGLGVEEVSLFPPPRKTGKKEGDDDKENEGLGESRPLDLPVQTDLLESEADVLEELKKLSAIHDAMDPSHLEPPTRPPFKVEESSGMGIGGAVEDHYSKSDEDDDSDDDGDDSDEEDDESNDEEEDEEEEEEDETTEDPAREVASLEERLSKSLRRLAERRKQNQKGYGAEEKLTSVEEYNGGYSPSGFYIQGSGPGTAPETASAPGTALGVSEDSAPGAYPGVPRTYPIGGEITSSAPEMPPLHEEKGDETSRAVMKKAHMARKLMDPEDPKKDEDLLELMLRIAENPDEWKRVHHLLRQLDDDLTTYEKTMHRMQALALERSSERGETKKGRKKKPGEEEQEDKEQRRIEMSKSGLPSGTHGENLSSTTQQPLQTPSTVTSASTHHKDWPRFAYHRVTTAPHPYFLQQQQNHQDGTPHHRNAYIAVSVITPPKGRHGGTSKPLSSPPPVNAVSPTPEAPYRRLYVTPAPESVPPQPRVVVDVGGREISEETLREPMEEEIVENVAKAASRGRHHKVHGDPIEEQLRTLAGVEAKLRHRLHEKERMRHVLQEAGKGEQYEDYNRSKRSVKRSANKRQNRPNGLILRKTS